MSCGSVWNKRCLRLKLQERPGEREPHPYRKESRRAGCHRELSMSIHVTTGPIVSLIAGILILVMPRLLNYIVAIYLIVIGLLGLGIFGRI
jgi:hypothetical protein